jgi:RNA polymerase sigma-70 factor (ECF subfamily)
MLREGAVVVGPRVRFFVPSEKALRSANEAMASDYERVLRDCAAGHEGGIDQIYRAEHRKMHRVVQRIVHDGAGAEDVIHDAFIQIMRDAGAFDPSRGTARAWIYTIVRNVALKRRQRDRREFAIDGEVLDAMCEDDRCPLEADARMAEYASLRTSLEALDPRHRASLILGIIDGHTHAEIASYLGVPCGTVKSWIRRELVALREQLK